MGTHTIEKTNGNSGVVKIIIINTFKGKEVDGFEPKVPFPHQVTKLFAVYEDYFGIATAFSVSSGFSRERGSSNKYTFSRSFYWKRTGKFLDCGSSNRLTWLPAFC